ncbi:MAG: hypothetical protein FJX95_04980 [Bacteroidetes bacterium]|nr:hypothetical protein [Bacteroidota bacterium]
MDTLKKIVFIFLLVSFAPAMMAQKETPANFEEANTLIEEKLWDQAVIEWRKLLVKKPLNANYHYKLGRCLMETKDKKDALEHLETACGSGKFSKNYDPYDESEELPPFEALAYLAKAQHLNNKPEDALDSYELLKTKISTKHILMADLSRQQEMCEEAKLQLKSPKNHKIVSLGKGINTEFKDFNAVAPKDLSILYFSSNRERADSSNARLVDPETMVYLDDMYMSFRGASNKWGPAELLNINANISDRICAVSADGHSLFIARGPRDDSEFLMSILVGETWIDPIPLSSSINSSFQEMDMTVTPDGKTIYFSSNRPNGLGGFDLYRSNLQKNREWSEPENLGELINTKYNELSPSVGGNGKILYFSSEGHNTMGGYDLFSSRIEKKGVLGNAVNVGYPLSTTDDDYYFQAIPVSRKGFITSSKIGGSGLQDIYEVTLARDPNETPVILKGFVQLMAGKTMPAGLKILAKAKDEDLKVEANLESSTFELKLPPCANYNVQVMQEKSVLHEFTVDACCDESMMTVEHEFYIFPVIKKQPVKADLAAKTTAKKSEEDPDKAAKKAEKEAKKAKEDEEKRLKEAEKKAEKKAKEAAKEAEQMAKKIEKAEKQGLAARPKPAGVKEKLTPTQYFFTYGMFKVNLEDMGLFVEEVALLIEKRGLVEIDVYASSSKVPRSNKKSNEELAEQRASDAKATIRKELERMGYVEGIHFNFRKISWGVNGKEFANDAKENMKIYEKYQYVELSAEG